MKNEAEYEFSSEELGRSHIYTLELYGYFGL